jgi:hypothetical protein
MSVNQRPVQMNNLLQHMKRLTVPMALAIGLLTFASIKLAAQDATAKYDYAMAKWDGPDRIQYILPDKFEEVRIFEKHPLPQHAQAEEFCLTMAANEMAKQGWQAVNLNSRRILFRRAAAK